MQFGDHTARNESVVGSGFGVLNGLESNHPQRREAYPLRLILLAALGDSEGILKLGFVIPQLKLLERWSASEKIKHRADNGLLFGTKLDARSCVNVGALDFQVG